MTSHTRLRRMLAASLVVLGITAAPAGAAIPSTPDAAAYAVGGRVNAVATTATRTYIGGLFTSVGVPTPGGAGLDPASGALLPSFARLSEAAATVAAVVGDGSGGFYIGGTFTQIGGVSIRNLAHVKADGSVDTAFAPNPNQTVDALLLSGTTLYAGGSFTTIGGQNATAFLARLNTTATTTATSVDTTFRPGPTDAVSALALSGTTLYAGGRFTGIGGQSATPRLAKLITTATTAAASVDTTFRPAPNNTVQTLALSGTTLYAGGNFTSVGGQTATPRLAKLDTTATTAAASVDTTFRPAPDSTVYAFTLSGTKLYTGGAFTTIGGQTATPSLARLDTTATTAAASVDTTFRPAPNGSTYSIVLSGTTLYAGGIFNTIGGQTATPNLAKLDTSTGSVDTTFTPRPSNGVNAVAVSGATLYAGGVFGVAGGTPVANLAALKRDGTVDPTFAPNPDNTVRALALSGSSLYAGGTFATIGGQTATARLARLDTTTGSVDTTFALGVDNGVGALVLSGTTMYVSGGFTTIGGQTATPRLAKLNTATRTVDTTFSPDPDLGPDALALSGTSLYAGGSFTTIGGQSATPNLARLNTSTNSVDTTFTPAPNNLVNALALSGTTLYAGGNFTTIGGQTATPRLAKLDTTATTTAASVDTTFAPAPNSNVNALALSGTALYVGGFFTAIGGQSATPNLAKLDTTATTTATTVDRTFSPSPNNGVGLLAITGSTLYAGGAFTGIGGVGRSGYAQFTDAGAPTAVRWRGGTARALGGHAGVGLAWRTGLATDNLGFDVLRVRRGHRSRLKITRALIPGGAVGRGTARSYRFTDRHGRRGDRYYVVDRDLDGHSVLHPLGAAR